MSSYFVSIPSSIHIYQGVAPSRVNGFQIADYLRGLLKKIEIDIRPEFFSFYITSYCGKEKEGQLLTIAAQLARLKIRDISKKNTSVEPLSTEIEYEKRNLLSSSKIFGIMYEGFMLQQLCVGLIPEEERDIHHLHLLVTNQLCGTWDEKNHRYHARASIYGVPSLISVSGIVEAPAKPRDFYLRKQLGEDQNLLKREYKDSLIDYGDSHLTEVVKGYAAQALFYCLVGYPFCEDTNCRLFNAHRQSELLHAQLFSPYEFCPEHQRMIDALREVEV